MKIFLLGDAAACAKANQKVPQGYYNLEVMLRGAARRGTLEQLTDWTQWTDSTLVF